MSAATLTRVLSRTTSWDCRVWDGGTQSKGYGSVSIEGTTYLVHRVVWEAQNGPIPDGLTVDHRCRNKLCLNVAHMELVTRGENIRRRLRAILFCERGHRLTTRTRAGVQVKCCRTCESGATS